MLDEGSLKIVLHEDGLTIQDQLLLCLAVDPDSPKSVSRIKELAIYAGQPRAKKWNISDYLSRAKGLAIRVVDGWELTPKGRIHVSTLAGPAISSPLPAVASGLRGHVAKLTSSDTRSFVEEAVRCYEARLYRGAVVLAWVGAMSVLYDRVVDRDLAAFNAEASRRDSKWKNAKTKDDLATMKEHTFLQVLHAISVIGKSVKDELEGCLKTRNGCGHPNSLKVGEAKVAAHIETLIQNVFAVF